MIHGKVERGKLIVFEGIDGCGKTSVINYIKNLPSYNIKEVAFLRDPGSTHANDMIREILLTKDPKIKLAPLAEILLFGASRIHLTEIVMRKLEMGINVVLDRYTMSSIVYQGYGNCPNNSDGQFLDYIKEVNKFSLEPDMTILLKIDLETKKKRFLNNNLDTDRLDLQTDEYYNALINGYEKEIKKVNNGIIIDATQKFEDVCNDVVSKVITYL